MSVLKESNIRERGTKVFTAQLQSLTQIAGASTQTAELVRRLTAPYLKGKYRHDALTRMSISI